MGLFDSIVDGLISLPGEIVSKTVETVVRAPEIGINVVKGVVDGVEKGVEKVEDSFD